MNPCPLMRDVAVCGLILLSLSGLLRAEESMVAAGRGSYATALPPGAKEPPPPVYKTENVRGPVPTNQWWSSLVWDRFSEAQYPHPLAVRAVPSGLQVYYPGATLTANKIGIMGEMPAANSGQDFILGHSRQAVFPDARLHDYSDWFVTASLAEGGRRMRVSYGHGSPYVYAVYEGGGPRLAFRAVPRIWSGDAASPVLGVSIQGRHYGLFAPRGSRWSGLASNTWTCDSGGKPYFSIALLPDAAPETLALFARHAHVHVTGTQVEWAYDSNAGTVRERFTYATKACEGEETKTLFALYPHQWRVAGAELTGKTYQSVRGVMKLACGTSFATRRDFPGVLFALPDAGTDQRPTLRRLLIEEVAKAAPGVMDTYGAGKRLGKVASLVPIAEQLADSAAKEKLLAELKGRLENWFDAAASGPDRSVGAKQTAAAGATPAATPPGRRRPSSLPVFYYNRPWGTLIGYPAAYGSDDQLNDHHFHYGYFLRAAAEVARNDPAWAAEQQWGGMVHLLVRDIASPSRRDPLFPRLRCFDPYAGHSWASGHARFGSGNNQESSSEAMNAWTGLVLWGEAAGSPAVRDLGIYLYTSELAAINEYWFDVQGENRPKEYTPSVVTMVWGGKSVNETWFSAKPALVHGINWLPIHGGSLYLGQYPEYVRRNYQALVKESGGEVWDDWGDLVLMYRALDNPRAAIRRLAAVGPSLAIEGGNSRANLYHWVHALDALGQVQRGVTADYPLFAVFRRGRELAYVVENIGPQPRTVTFSDGAKVTAAAGAFRIERRREE
jgi:endoglucanase Acf2